jgi:transposase
LRYREKEKEEKRSATLDKRRYLDEDDMIVQAEDSARNNDLKGMYNVIRKISGRSTPEVVQVRDKDGKMLCSET